LREFFPNAVKIFCLLPNNDPKPLISSKLQHNFKKTLLKDSLNRWEDKLGLVSVIENLNALEKRRLRRHLHKLYPNWSHKRSCRKLQI